MAGRPLKFRLRTLLIATALIALLLTRIQLYPFYNGLGHQLDLLGFVGRSRVSLYYFTKEFRQSSPASFIDCRYVDRCGNQHGLSGLFSFRECRCCGCSWEWDDGKERYAYHLGGQPPLPPAVPNQLIPRVLEDRASRDL
jgi:hypothetical protein